VEAYIRQPGTENSMWYLDSLISILVGGAQAEGRFVLLQTSEARGREPPRHIHQYEDEVIIVLEGELEITIGDTHIDAGQGACLLLPRGVEHSFVLRSEEAKLLVLLPARLEGYFRELSRPAAHSPGPPDGDSELQVERLIATAARYGLEIVGPA
jgi:quercetin dioxygenase-like cupin family protein